MKLTERMKKCKSWTGILIPAQIYLMDFDNPYEFKGEPLGKAYVLYHASTMQIETDLVDNKEQPFEIKDHIRLKQDYDSRMLVVYCNGVH